MWNSYGSLQESANGKRVRSTTLPLLLRECPPVFWQTTVWFITRQSKWGLPFSPSLLLLLSWSLNVCSVYFECRNLTALFPHADKAPVDMSSWIIWSSCGESHDLSCACLLCSGVYFWAFLNGPRRLFRGNQSGLREPQATAVFEYWTNRCIHHQFLRYCCWCLKAESLEDCAT